MPGVSGGRRWPSRSGGGLSARPLREADGKCGRACTWVRSTAWPTAEELFATAPTRVIDKQDQNFEQAWDALISGSTAQLPLD